MINQVHNVSPLVNYLIKLSFLTGNGTCGLEIYEEVPDVDAIIVPYGGGGLSSGIALAAKGRNPKIKVYACEVETAAPVKASFNAGRGFLISSSQTDLACVSQYLCSVSEFV